MAGKLRVQYPGAIYHLMNRGDRREPIFKDDADAWSGYPAYLQTPSKRPAWLRVDRLPGELGIRRDDAAGWRRFAQAMEERRRRDEPQRMPAMVFLAQPGPVLADCRWYEKTACCLASPIGVPLPCSVGNRLGDRAVPSPSFKTTRAMRTETSSEPVSRREFLRTTASVAATAAAGGIVHTAPASHAQSSLPPAAAVCFHPLLTPADQFRDVSRGNPKPHKLTGDALQQARLTPETWRLEIVADPFTSELVKEPAHLERQFSLADGTALDLLALLELGRKRTARFLKAMQCLNIPAPLGQGLWEGVPLREVLRICGEMRNVRLDQMVAIRD